jgi:hypothetical protein
MMIANKKTGVVRGCIVPILSVIGFVALCFVFCFVLYTLNTAVAPNANSNGGFLPIPIF